MNALRPPYTAGSTTWTTPLNAAKAFGYKINGFSKTASSHPSRFTVQTSIHQHSLPILRLLLFQKVLGTSMVGMLENQFAWMHCCVKYCVGLLLILRRDRNAFRLVAKRLLWKRTHLDYSSYWSAGGIWALLYWMYRFLRLQALPQSSRWCCHGEYGEQWRFKRAVKDGWCMNAIRHDIE